MLCACTTCYSLPFKIGLCRSHYEEFKKLPYVKGKHWAFKHKIFRFHNGNFKNKGRLLISICPKCTSRYVSSELGHLRKCSICSSRKMILRKLEENRNKKKSITDRLDSLPKDQDDRYKPFNHSGGPKKVTWECEKPECNNTFEVVLLNNKKWYNRFCGGCRV